MIMEAEAKLSKRIDVMGTKIDAVTRQEAVEHVAAWMQAGEPTPRHIVTANPEMVMAARAEAAVKEVLSQADLVVADGVGLVWAAQWLGEPLPQRVAGIDLAEALVAHAALGGQRVFLLGAEPGIAERAAGVLAARYPGLRIVGTRHGFFSADEENDVLQTIEESGADLVLVAMGAPRQEMWIARVRSLLSVRVWIGVGGAFDVFAGKVRRAPRWIRRIGLEWLYRIAQDPRRRFRRAMVLPRFAIRVLFERWAMKGERSIEEGQKGR